MNIEIFPSASGDCLLVTSKDGKRLLADAGRPDAYDDFIAAPLSALRTAGKHIDVAYISHIDRDHIGGILRLLDHEVKWRVYDRMRPHNSRLKPPAVPRPPAIGQVWHNAFLESIEKTEGVSLGSALGASAGALSGLNAAGLGRIDAPAATEAEVKARAIAASVADETRMLATSVGDAIEINWRVGNDQLDIPLNPDFGGALMTARKQAIGLGSLAIRVLGPTSAELTELRKDWIKWLKKSAEQLEKLRKAHERDAADMAAGVSPLELAARSRELALSVEKDVTPPNLASLVLLVEEGKRRLLLTGDAGDESLLRYMTAAKLFDANNRIEVDVLKVPHHGAHNSYSKEFAQRVRASHLVFCGDGEHNNPEPEVVRGYIDTVKAEPLSGGRTTTFWFNWSSARAVEFKEFWKEVEALFQGAPAKIKRRSLKKGEVSMKIDLP